jgi:hypothetical protein
MKPISSVFAITLTACLTGNVWAEEGAAAAGAAAAQPSGGMEHQMGQGGAQGMQNMQEMHKNMQEMHKGMNMQGGQAMPECPKGKECPAAAGGGTTSGGGMQGMEGHGSMGGAPK